jgi:hypothetical protein
LGFQRGCRNTGKFFVPVWMKRGRDDIGKFVVPVEGSLLISIPAGAELPGS